MYSVMSRMSLLWWLFFVAVSCGPMSNSVGDAGVDVDGTDPVEHEPTHLTLEGSVCFESPSDRLIESKVVLIVDQSDFVFRADPALHLTSTLRDLVAQHQSSPVSFAVLGLGGSPILHAPSSGSFTDNIGEIESAIALLSTPQGCNGEGRCRDLPAAMATASTLIAEDMEGIPPNELALTEYSVVLVLAGPPDPSIDQIVQCADSSGETVLCDPGTTDCQRDLRALICCPTGSGTPCVPSGSSSPYCCTAEPCPSECSPAIETPYTGLYAQQVNDLSAVVDGAGAYGFVMHTVHLVPPASYPQEVETNEMVSTILEVMAEAGSGIFGAVDPHEYPTLISELSLSTLVEPELMTLLVSNLNAAIDEEGRVAVDSDGDGLTDRTEIDRGTDPSAPDSDGDGFGDFAELSFGLDPLDGHDSDCVGDGIALDLDLDGIGACEERLLGSHRESIDSDGDLIPDGMELRLGTDYLEPDDDQDRDGDGTSNGEEVRLHTDPRSSRDDSEPYQYRVLEQGLVSRAVVGTPRLMSGISIVEASRESAAGLGWLCYEPAASGVGGNLCWVDAGARDPLNGRALSCDACITSVRELMVLVTSDGDFALTSPGATGVVDEDLWIWVHVTVDDLPEWSSEEQIRVNRTQEVCYEYEVSGIQLFDTIASNERPDPGSNIIALHAAFGPEGATAPGARFKVAFVDARYPAEGEEGGRNQVITVGAEEFVSSPSFAGP